jgi:radical SAM protein with 4Fe4S-binding SPASM domain
VKPSQIITTNFPDFLKNKLDCKNLLFSFDYEMTARCNNNCRHCYINVPIYDKIAKQDELDMAQIEKIVDEAVSLGAMWCLLSGGEPLLRDDFEDIYIMLKKKGLLLSLFTNATLIKNRHIELFKKYPPRDIEVTVYGVTERTYGAVTSCPSNFAAFKRGLDLLIENKIPVRLKTMALKSNFQELPKIAEFCRKHSKDYFRFDPLLHLRVDGNIKRNNEIISERLSPEEIVSLEHADPKRSEALQKGCKIFIKDSVEKDSCGHIFKCGAGLDSFSISYDGYFRLCSSLVSPECVFDLKKGGLKDAWPGFVSKVRSIKTSNAEIIEKCNKCNIFNLCLWCPAHSHLETGKIDSWSDYFCKVANARAVALKNKIQCSEHQISSPSSLNNK